MPVASLRARPLLVWLHRWVGLVIALFLVVAGLTGSVLAWYQELDEALNPQLWRLPAGSESDRLLDPIALRDRVLAAYPHAEVSYVDLRQPAGRAALFFLEPQPGQPPLPHDEVFVDPRNGQVLGERRWGDLSQGRATLMTFLYRLHFELALGRLAGTLLGVVALLWTIDCFIGAALTFPPRGRASQRGGWWRRWAAAWALRPTAGAYRLNVDLHRAGGLWAWALLFVFAWSSVAFNLMEVYHPVMRTLLGTQTPPSQLAPPVMASAAAPPGISWQQARTLGQRHLQQLAAERGFQVIEERSLAYYPASASFRYRARTDLDVSSRHGQTTVVFSAVDGRLIGSYLPTGAAAGDTVTHWLLALHMAAVGGWPMQVAVSVLGLVVAMLSVTGIVIWWHKRRGRLHRRRRPAAATITSAAETPAPRARASRGT